MPRLDWSSRGARPLPNWKAGDLVIPDQHPPDSAIWRIISIDGMIILLENTKPGNLPRQTKRDARTVRKADRT